MTLDRDALCHAWSKYPHTLSTKILMKRLSQLDVKANVKVTENNQIKLPRPLVDL